MERNHEDGHALNGFPHAGELGMRMHDHDKVLVSVPYDERLIGDPETGVIHGGVITTMLDSACGIAAIQKTGLLGFIATLDLRIDYMRPAKPGKALWAECECYRVTRSVAFCRGVAYDDQAGDPVASAAGAFMLTKPPSKKAKR